MLNKELYTDVFELNRAIDALPKWTKYHTYSIYKNNTSYFVLVTGKKDIELAENVETDVEDSSSLIGTFKSIAGVFVLAVVIFTVLTISGGF